MSKVFVAVPVDRLAAEYPPTRDRVLDAARAFSLLVVVVGHFIMLAVHWDPPTTGNTLASGRPWPYVTWAMQVMPLFFIAGGAVNSAGWRSHQGSYGQWLYRRVRRLMQPTLIFLVGALVIFTVAGLIAPTAEWLYRGATGPLWFLAVYLPILAATPIAVRLDDRFGVRVPVVGVVLVLLVDVTRFGADLEVVGLLNLLLVWGVAHQLGLLYAERARRPLVLLVGVAALLGNVLLTVVMDTYPISMVGIPGEALSNMSPPTLPAMLHVLVMFAVLVGLRPWLDRQLHRPAIFRVLLRAGATAMTVYLWHMLVLAFVLQELHAMGIVAPTRLEPGNPNPLPDGLAYWGITAVILVIFGALLWAVVRLLWPLEHVHLSATDPPTRPLPGGTPAGIAGVILVSAGLLAVAGTGVAGGVFGMADARGITLPVALSLVLALSGTALTWLAAAPAESLRRTVGPA